MRKVVDVWAERTEALLARPEVEYVLVFENRGREVGATIDHPHGQIYGYPFVPPAPAREGDASRAHGCGVCEEVARELESGARIVCEHDDWIAYVPFAAAYPYGMRFAPRAHIGALPALDRRFARRVWPRCCATRSGATTGSGPRRTRATSSPTCSGSTRRPRRAATSGTSTGTPRRRCGRAGVQRYVASGELGSATLANPVVPEVAARELRDA